MASWDDGYVTDIPYTTHFFREFTPPWLTFASLLAGHRPPDFSRAFTFAELGFGFGFTATGIAASHPHAEIWGCDFNPAHVEGASRLAAAAGLTNATFAEASFAELAANPDLGPARADVIVLHGVYSWVSAENRRHLVDFIRQRLAPGGIVYNSYNVSTGWAAMGPVRELMRLIATASGARSDRAVPEVLDYLARLKDGGAAFFPANPATDARLATMKTQDARYIAHEYLNADWHPQMFAEVAEEMAAAKCGFIGSASLTDNIPATSVPAALFPLLAEAHDTRLRETLRDFAGAQSFRRDIYRRGDMPLNGVEHLALLDQVSLVGFGKAAEDEITFNATIGNVTGKKEVYQPLLDMLARGPTTIREIRAAPGFAGLPVVEAINAAALLVSGGFAHPVLAGWETSGAAPGARKLNAAIAAMTAEGTDINHLLAPAAGTMVGSNLIEILALGQIAAGAPADDASLVGYIRHTLARTGRNMQQQGQPITDPAEIDRVLNDAIQTIRTRIATILGPLGMVDR